MLHGSAMPTAARHSFLHGVNAWVKSKSAVWEANRMGIIATGIFLQVTVAGVMICLAGMAGASPFAFGAGILFAFMADSIALAQAPMRWVIGMVGASILVNIGLSIYFGLLLS